MARSLSWAFLFLQYFSAIARDEFADFTQSAFNWGRDTDPVHSNPFYLEMSKWPIALSGVAAVGLGYLSYRRLREKAPVCRRSSSCCPIFLTTLVKWLQNVFLLVCLFVMIDNCCRLLYPSPPIDFPAVFWRR